MTEEQKASTTGQASTVESVSQAVEPAKEPAKEVQVTPQPLTPEIEARIQQAVAEANQRAIEQGKEIGRREMQAIKDREVAEAQKRTRLAESRARILDESFSGLDEETRQAIELKKLRSENQYYQSAEQTEQARVAQETYVKQLNETLVDHLKTLGIDSEDKRVDWAKDATDYLAGRSRFDASVAKIIKGNQKTTEDKVTSHLKEMELKLRRELGLDSVDTTTGSGIESDDAFRKRIVDPNHMTTNEDLKRIAELQKKLS